MTNGAKWVRFWDAVRTAAEMAAQRLFGLLATSRIEGSEFLSIVAALAWLVPLLANPTFLTRTPSLSGVASLVPVPFLTAMMAALMVYQSTAVALGGPPSFFVKTSGDVRHWYKLRRAGLAAAGFVWFLMALLLASSGWLTPGFFLFGSLGVSCYYGVWRFCLLLYVEREYAGLKEIRGDSYACVSPAQEGTAAT